jgi:hypothetical protein
MNEITNYIFKKIINKKINALDYIKELFRTYNLELKYNNIEYFADIFTLINCFIPLPTKLKFNNNYIYNFNNEYTYIGYETNELNILTTDRIIFLDNTIPIPFTLPLYKNNNIIELVLSNVYYYELSILNKFNEKIKDKNIISIGFINGNSKISYNSLGIIKNNFHIKKVKKWINGDTVGIGFIYDKSNLIKFFFTYNGKIIHQSNSIKILSNKIIPIIIYEHTNTIKLNFFNDIFKFNINKLINNNLVLSSENIFMENYDDKLFKNDFEENYLENFNNNSDIFNNLINNLLSTLQNSNITEINVPNILSTIPTQNIEINNISNFTTLVYQFI